LWPYLPQQLATPRITCRHAEGAGYWQTFTELNTMLEVKPSQPNITRHHIH
jgi:hypothetical protein